MCVIQINSDPNLQRGIRRGVALVRVERKVGCSILGRDRPESLTTFSDSAWHCQTHSNRRECHRSSEITRVSE